MKTLLFLFLFAFTTSLHAQTYADTLKFHAQGIRHGDYIVEITLPPGYEAGKAYPVCYFLDLMLAEPLMKDISDSLQRNGLAGDYIFVGIKCEDTARWSIAQRTQDFTPSYSQQQDYKAGNKGDTDLKLSGGAPKFLAFLKNEIIFEVEKRYPCVPGKRTLFGNSLSGLFAVYTMVKEPELFNQYIIGSPALWYNNEEVINSFKETPAKNFSKITHIYMCIGGKEAAVMLEDFNTLVGLMKKKKLNVDSEILPGKNHTGIWTLLLVNGIKSTFPK